MQVRMSKVIKHNLNTFLQQFQPESYQLHGGLIYVKEDTFPSTSLLGQDLNTIFLTCNINEGIFLNDYKLHSQSHFPRIFYILIPPDCHFYLNFGFNEMNFPYLANPKWLPFFPKKLYIFTMMALIDYNLVSDYEVTFHYKYHQLHLFP